MIISTISNNELDIFNHIYSSYKLKPQRYMFIEATKYGRLNFIKFLFNDYINIKSADRNFKLDIKSIHKELFRIAEKNNHIDIFYWLKSLT